MTTRTRLLIATAAFLGQVVASGITGAQTVVVRTQGNWTVTTTTLPGGSNARSVSEGGEVVGEGLTPEGLSIRPIWFGGATIGTLEGIAGTPYSWDSQRNAVGVHVVNSKIACSVWWTSAASGQLDECTGSAYDINEFGESAGSARSTTPTPYRRVVTWKNGVIHRDLGLPPGAREAHGAGINDFGEVAGNLTDAATGRIEAFVYSNGAFTRLPALPGPYASYAWDINNKGDVVGTSNGGIPVVWKAGASAPTVLPLPAGRYPHSVWRINDNGDVVGTASAVYPLFYSAVLWRNGEFIELGVLPTGTESYAYDINNAGLIVGTSTTGSPYGWHAVTWQVTPATGANLSLSMTDSPDPVRRGSTLVYTILVGNAGPEPGAGVTLTDTLPTALNLQSAISTKGSCAGTSVVTCTIGSLAVGETVTVTISARARTVGTVTNAASVTATTPDPAAANNTASTTTVVTRR